MSYNDHRSFPERPLTAKEKANVVQSLREIDNLRNAPYLRSSQEFAAERKAERERDRIRKEREQEYRNQQMYSARRESQSNNTNHSNTSPVIGEIGALLLCLLAILPMVLLQVFIHYKDQIMEFFYRFV